jgi:hypothetical protein
MKTYEVIPDEMVQELGYGDLNLNDGPAVAVMEVTPRGDYTGDLFYLVPAKKIPSHAPDPRQYQLPMI